MTCEVSHSSARLEQGVFGIQEHTDSRLSPLSYRAFENPPVTELVSSWKSARAALVVWCSQGNNW